MPQNLLQLHANNALYDGYFSDIDNRAGLISARQGMLRDTLVISVEHEYSMRLLSGAEPRVCEIGRSRDRVQGGPYVGIIYVQLGSRVFVTYVNPGCVALRERVERIQRQGFIHIAIADEVGIGMIARPVVSFLEAAMEVHDISRQVSSEAFQAAADTVDYLLKHPELMGQRQLTAGWPHPGGKQIYSARSAEHSSILKTSTGNTLH